MSEEEIMQHFTEFLQLVLGIDDPNLAQQAYMLLDEQQKKQLQNLFIQVMQQAQPQPQTPYAKLGAKLNYIKSLRGVCPDGYEAKYFKSGGSLVKKCAKCQHQEVMADGGKTKDPVKKFKEDRKKKKGYPLIGDDGKTTYYEDRATRDSLAVNRYGDSVTSGIMPGNLKGKGDKMRWVPDRTKAPYKKSK